MNYQTFDESDPYNTPSLYESPIYRNRLPVMSPQYSPRSFSSQVGFEQDTPAQYSSTSPRVSPRVSSNPRLPRLSEKQLRQLRSDNAMRLCHDSMGRFIPLSQCVRVKSPRQYPLPPSMRAAQLTPRLTPPGEQYGKRPRPKQWS